MAISTKSLLFLLFIIWIFPLHVAGADPCDFTSSGAFAFPYDQVVACYESVPFDHGDLENIIEVIAQHRSFSDLGELYDARSNWIANLSALDDPTTMEDFANDFAMHNAFMAEHKRLLNLHVRYTQPGCYWQMLNAFVPFDYGVTTRFLGADEKQIVFIEGAPILPSIYLQATGIDASLFIGMKIVAINDVPVLEYFRTFGREKLKYGTNDSLHLNEILNQFGYSFRFVPTRDFIPERGADEYLLESRNGVQFSVTLPWVFLRRDLFNSAALPPTASTEEFVNLCQAPLPSPFSAAGEVAAVNWIWSDQGELEPEKRLVVAAKVSRPEVTDKDFFEVPPGLVGKHIEEIIPRTNAAQVLQFRKNVTAIRMFNTVDWVDVARAGIEHACQTSKRLIIDVRRNGGGNDTVIRWLYQHLFPGEDDLVEAGLLPLRQRNDNIKMNELFAKSALFESVFVPMGVPSCAISLGPQCMTDLNSGDPLPLSDLDWFLDPSVTEQRAGVPVSLSRQFGLGQNFVQVFPEFDAASCAGRFVGKNLIFLTDATNASGGYVLPAAFKGKGVIVTMGGYVDEPIVMGQARSGATLPASLWALLANLMEFVSEGLITFDEEYVQFERNVESNMEMWGSYQKDRTTLHFNEAVEADLRLHVWSDSPGTEGYVYSRLLEAVDTMEDQEP